MGVGTSAANPPLPVEEGKEDSNRGAPWRRPDEPPPPRGKRSNSCSAEAFEGSGDRTPRLDTISNEEEECPGWRRAPYETPISCRRLPNASLPPGWRRPTRGRNSPPRHANADRLVVNLPPMEEKATHLDEPQPPKRKGSSNNDAGKESRDRIPECNAISSNGEECRIRKGEGGCRMTTRSLARSLSKRESNVNTKRIQMQLNPLQEEWEKFDLNTKQQKEPNTRNITAGDRNTNAEVCNTGTTLMMKEEENTQREKNTRLQLRGIEYNQTPNQTQRSNNNGVNKKMQRNGKREHNIKDTSETPADRPGPVTRSRSRVQTSTKPI